MSKELSYNPFKLNKVTFFLAILSAAAHGEGTHAEIDPLAKYRTRDDVHGLYEIREAAENFLARDKAKGGPDDRAGDPNLKTQVTRCAVPVTVNRMPKSAGYTGSNVKVNCRKTVLPQMEKDWFVIVPVHTELERRRLR